MIELSPEQEAIALAALEAKEARTKAQVIAVKPGAIERNSIEPTQNVIPVSEKSDEVAVRLSGKDDISILQRLRRLLQKR